MALAKASIASSSEATSDDPPLGEYASVGGVASGGKHLPVEDDGHRAVNGNMAVDGGGGDGGGGRRGGPSRLSQILKTLYRCSGGALAFRAVEIVYANTAAYSLFC